jgi:hypothetical protein
MQKRFLAIVVLSTIFLASTSSVVSAVVPLINLPTSLVSIRIRCPDPNCYYIVTLGAVPSDYHVSNGEYLGWCVDEYHLIYEGKTYWGRMYSSYDPANPQADPDWDKVNYILNHKQGNKDDVQAAIWYFVDGGTMPSTAAGQAMVNEAIANGQGFVPMSGQILAVVLWINCRTQVPIIEVIVPLQQVLPEYPLGSVLGIATFVAALGIFKYRRKIPKIA